MSKAVAVSFEGDQVKIVHASYKGHTIYADRTEIIREDDFDSYLREEKAAEFIVTCEFRGAHHGVITIPLARSRYLAKIIESRIRKETGEKDFSFVYNILGEDTAENKKVLEVFYYSISNMDLRHTAKRFYDNGKTLRAVYPAVFSAVSLLGPTEDKKTNMGVFSTGNERTIFLANNGTLNFIRNYDSYEKGLTDYDIQNINMTLTYCSQSLRINPSSVLLMGDLSGPSDISSLPTVPLSAHTRNSNIHCSAETYDDFLLPLSAFLAPESSNILSREFRNVNLLKNYFAYASMIFIILSVLCALFAVQEAEDSSTVMRSLEASAGRMEDIEKILSVFDEKEEEIRRYRPAVEFLNRPSPAVYDLMVSLGRINTRGLTFNAVEARTAEGNTLAVKIDGTSHADTYASLQSSLNNVVNTLKKTEKTEVTNSSIDLTNNAFTIELNYRSE
ncbi:MAG: hypothetical protein AB1499_01260 [Nitrospirota bacterium]